ncbi:uncharacterized protein C8Q71DRAFT_752943 [Rhodofomes roseus]|uniref:Uncharacterized protein n=1 Tax=Rhodofomes roseus TaxID=34475 RepID=A0ABQ8KLL4_9APHY|nr:uncharacterized protein C8Q71DRAFT_752943 [Rhodofomes roseus]KAH9838800.1 hypothetical protein C8Q71DRAFT_752943 [Rhodofomes roseus]
MSSNNSISMAVSASGAQAPQERPNSPSPKELTPQDQQPSAAMVHEEGQAHQDKEHPMDLDESGYLDVDEDEEEEEEEDDDDDDDEIPLANKKNSATAAAPGRKGSSKAGGTKVSARAKKLLAGRPEQADQASNFTSLQEAYKGLKGCRIGCYLVHVSPSEDGLGYTLDLALDGPALQANAVNRRPLSTSHLNRIHNHMKLKYKGFMLEHSIYVGVQSNWIVNPQLNAVDDTDLPKVFWSEASKGQKAHMLNGQHRLAASMKLVQPLVKDLLEADKALSTLPKASQTYRDLEARREEIRQEIQEKTTWAVQLFDLGKVAHLQPSLFISLQFDQMLSTNISSSTSSTSSWLKMSQMPI